MYRFDPARASSAAVPVLPRYLAAVPADLRGNDGCYVWRGPRTGRTLRHASMLVLGVVATLESHPGTLDVVSFDDMLAEGGPDWAEDIAGRLDGDLAPDILVKGTMAGRSFVQAVTAVDNSARAAPINREEMRIRYRERGCAWSLVQEGDLDSFRAAGWLWLGNAVRRGAPDAAMRAVEKVILEGEVTPLAQLLFRAAFGGGVPVDVAADALGCLVFSRRIKIDLAGGVIATDRPFTTASHDYPAAIARSWQGVGPEPDPALTKIEFA